MPVDLEDADTGGVNLLFADDLQGIVFELREQSVYSAEEVRERTESDVPKFGRWLPVETEADGDSWAVAVGEFVEELQRVENAMALTLEVTRCEKSGTEQTDPYEVNVEVANGDPKQSGL